MIRDKGTDRETDPFEILFLIRNSLNINYFNYKSIHSLREIKVKYWVY